MKQVGGGSEGGCGAYPRNAYGLCCNDCKTRAAHCGLVLVPYLLVALVLLLLGAVVVGRAAVAVAVAAVVVCCLVDCC